MTRRRRRKTAQATRSEARRTFLWKLVAGYAVVITAIKNTLDLIGPWVAKPAPAPVRTITSSDTFAVALGEVATATATFKVHVIRPSVTGG